VEFSTEINDLEDLKSGMVLTGTVTNVANFGAFVDLGVHQDGLIHISKIADSFVKNPHEVLSVGDTVSVEVLEVEVELKRISLKRLSGGKAPDAKRSSGTVKAPPRVVDQGLKIGNYLEGFPMEDAQ
jgi:uncharacterized protein